MEQKLLALGNIETLPSPDAGTLVFHLRPSPHIHAEMLSNCACFIFVSVAVPAM